MRRIFRWSLFLCLSLSAIYAFIFVRQDYLLLKYEPTASEYRFDYTDHVDELFFDGPNSGKIHALYFQHDNPKGAVLYFHGRGGNLAKTWAKHAERIYERGYDVLIPDYRQFGKSKGGLTQDILLEDAIIAYRFLLSRYEESEITVYGVSFGTGIATYVASQYNPKSLALEAPYYSMIELIPQTNYRWIPKFLLNLLLKYPLPTNEWIADVKSPIFLIHGLKDELISFECSEMLSQLVKDPKQTKLVTIEHANHSNLSEYQEYKEFMEMILP